MHRINGTPKQLLLDSSSSSSPSSSSSLQELYNAVSGGTEEGVNSAHRSQPVIECVSSLNPVHGDNLEVAFHPSDGVDQTQTEAAGPELSFHEDSISTVPLEAPDIRHEVAVCVPDAQVEADNQIVLTKRVTRSHSGIVKPRIRLEDALKQSETSSKRTPPPPSRIIQTIVGNVVAKIEETMKECYAAGLEKKLRKAQDRIKQQAEEIKILKSMVREMPKVRVCDKAVKRYEKLASYIPKTTDVIQSTSNSGGDAARTLPGKTANTDPITPNKGTDQTEISEEEYDEPALNWGAPKEIKCRFCRMQLDTLSNNAYHEHYYCTENPISPKYKPNANQVKK